MASQYLSRLGIVLGVDSGELVQEVEKARQQFGKFARQVSSDSNAAAKDILALRNATEDYGKTLSKVEQIEREIKSGRYMYATKTLQDQLLAEAKAYDLKAKSMKAVTGMMTEQQKLALSYQTTDLVTQIASGQSPFIAILQQGGQLKDQMGGLGNMFRMLGGLLTPFNVAMGAAATVVGALGYSFFKASQDAARFRDDLILTGNFAGTTQAQIVAFNQAISSDLSVSYSKVNDVVGMLIASGKYSISTFDVMSNVILKYSKLAGVDAKEAANKLMGAFDGTASSAKALNNQYNFLTLAQYKQIEALEKAGKAQEAIAVGANAFLGSIKDQKRDLGILERAWEKVGDMVNYVKDGILAIGRNTKQDQLQAIARQMQYLESVMSGTDTESVANRSKNKQEFEKKREQYLALAKEINDEIVAAQEEAEKKRKGKLGIDDYSATGGADKTLQMQKQLAKTRYEEWIEWAKLTATEEEKIQLDALKKIADKAIDLEYTGAQEKRARGLALLEQYEADKAAIEAEADRKRAEYRKKAQWEADQRWFDNLANVGERLEREQAKIFADIASKRDEVTSTKEQIQSKFSLLGATQKEIDLTMSRIEYQKELNKLQRSQEFKNMDSGKQKEALQELESIQKAKEANIELAESFKYVQGMYDAVWSNMSSAIETFVRTGKLSIKDFTRSVIQDMLIMNMKLQAMQLVRGLVGSITNFIGMKSGGGWGTGNAFGNQDLGGFFADGGSPPVGKASIVGERGPELFIPNTAGTIIPNNALSSMGSTTNVTNNYINAIDTKSFEQRLLESNQAVWSANQYAGKNLSTNFGRT